MKLLPNHSLNLLKEEVKANEVVFLYLGYSGVIVRTEGLTVAFDVNNLIPPEVYKFIDRMNLVFYTHDHPDHFHLETAMRIYETYGSLIIAEQAVYDKLNAYIPSSHLVRAPKAARIRIRDIIVRCISGKHVCPIILFFIIKGGVEIFHGGDSGYVDLSKFTANVAFIPTGKPSPTASPEDALKMVMDLKPKYAIAIHGTDSEREKFRDLVKSQGLDTEVLIPKVGEVMKISL